MTFLLALQQQLFSFCLVAGAATISYYTSLFFGLREPLQASWDFFLAFSLVFIILGAS
ncbi:hypothetical protein M1466_01775 [Candidatus Dependentiae bacterium]|nr:hypothetical protein [Candidatus Dependentiae bacterium]